AAPEKFTPDRPSPAALIRRHRRSHSPTTDRVQRQSVPAAIAEACAQGLISRTEVGRIDHVATDPAVRPDFLERQRGAEWCPAPLPVAVQLGLTLRRE